ncbi:MAG: PAS domain-containing sensor histidine kinase [Saprospiraceae bacterium]
MKNFKLKLSLYISAIFIGLVAATYGLNMANGMWLVVLGLGSVAILIFLLFRTVDKTNQALTNFLLNIQYDDYAVGYAQNRAETPSFKELNGAFNVITEKFREIRSQKEAQFQYLQAIVEHVDAGLICFDETGKTILMNRALQQLLRKSYFPNLTSVQKYNEELFKTLQELQPSERKLVKLVVNNRIVQLALRTTILKIGEEQLQLFAVQNIQAELEEQEVASWQKLIRILTHEIMNSVAPVVSLAETTSELIGDSVDFDVETSADVKDSIRAIHKRSQGLLNFTKTYRQLTKIPPPKFEKIDAVELLNTILILFKPRLKRQQIELVKNFPNTAVYIQADEELLEQVLINLLKNAIEAVANSVDPAITLSISKQLEGLTEINIIDNGPGITPEVQEQIFIPFFTTKEEGTGIGLSLCRQIIQQHKGSLDVLSEVGKGAIFTIRL